MCRRTLYNRAGGIWTIKRILEVRPGDGLKKGSLVVVQQRMVFQTIMSDCVFFLIARCGVCSVYFLRRTIRRFFCSSLMGCEQIWGRGAHLKSSWDLSSCWCGVKQTAAAKAWLRRQLTSGFYMEVHRSPAVLAIMGPFRAVYAWVCAQRLHSLFLWEFYGSIRSVDLIDLLPVR